MSSETSHTEYKFYMDSAKKNKILEDANPHEKYVILQNESLHNELGKLQSEIKRLELSVEELEEDNSRMEKSKGYTKNLLKNFAELDCLNIKFRQESDKYYSQIKIRQNKFIKRVIECIWLFNVIMTIYLGISFYYSNSMFSFGYKLGVYISFIFVSTESLINIPKRLEFKLINKTDNVRTITEDIKKINECYDFINEYIDNI